MAYTVSLAPMPGLGGPDAAQQPVFSSSMLAAKAPRPAMYIMQQPQQQLLQEPPKPVAAGGQQQPQIWLQAVPAPGQAPAPPPQQLAFRPAGSAVALQPAGQQQQQQVLYGATAPRLVAAAAPQQLQPVTYVKQGVVASPAGARLVQVAAPSGAPRPVVHGAEPAAAANVVYVSVNGALQRAVMQNGSIYLLGDAAAPAAATGGGVMVQQAAAAPQLQQVAIAAPAPQQQQLQQIGGIVQVQPNGQFQQAALQQQRPQQQVMMVPAGARLVPVSQVQGRVGVVQQPQQAVVGQGQPQPRPMVAVAMPSSGAAVAQPGGQQPVMLVMQQQQQQQGTQPTLVAPTVLAQASAPVAFRPQAVQMQMPLQFQTQQQMTRSVVAPAAPQAMMQPAAPQPMMPPVGHAGTPPQQANMPFRPAVAAGVQLLVPGAPVSASTASLVPGGARPAASAPLAVPSGMQQLVAPPPPATGEAASPPVPPITPGVAAAPGADVDATASSLLALLGGSSPPHGVIGSQRSASKDGGVGAGTPPRAGTPAAGLGVASSQPGTPARSNGSMGALSDASSTTSLPMAVPDAAADAPAAANGCSKAEVMRLVARSFIETGIPLEQAPAMIQPADRELLAAAYQAESAAAAAAAASSAAGPHLGSTLGGLGGEPISVPGAGGTSLGELRLEGLCLDDGKHSAPGNMGSWGFSLFARSDVGSDTGAPAVDRSLLPDVGAGPPCAAAAALPAFKDSAMVGMLSALNL